MVTVVTESPCHERLLDFLLSDLVEQRVARVIDGDSRDGARPLARQIIMLHGEPAVYAIDADTLDAGRIAQQEAELNFYFGLSVPREMFSVVHFVPALEVIFFERPRFLERLIGRRLDPVLKIAGEVAPRAVLERGIPELAGRKLSDRLDEITADELRELRAHPSIASIREFVEAHAELEPLRRTA